MPERCILFSTAYFAPIQYYSEFLRADIVYIEQFENFIKQTYRNRCVIPGGNGPIQLIVPVVKGRGPKILIKDLQISYDTDWQRNHWRTIFSAFSSSPFFEYYKDDIHPFFQKKHKYLLDFNLQIHETICELIEIENTAVFTDDFENVPVATLNLRESISPKNKMEIDDCFQPMEYTQVFSEKLGFIPNQSILDLLFNEGPNSFTILKASFVDS
ncbi:MAG TPA: WbqC family protein [Draconibacterium sp.]|nr:WbqC family protein [Draconibacterium sp.]